jgi:TonB-dependent starch-binding outer membrane protein SusC
LKLLNADTSDKKFNEKDMVIIGNSLPRYTWNFSNTFTYKSFSIDMQWYAVIGANKFNATRAASIMTGTNREVNSYIADTIKAIKTKEFYQSSEFVDDASFIRLKTLTVNYSPSKKFFGYALISLSLSFENILTFTKYNGYDPEATIYTDNNFSDNAIDKGAVPNPKSVYFTVGLTF